MAPSIPVSDAIRILLVDDDTRLVEMLTEFLAPEGIAVTAAAHGAQGLRLAQREDFDLIVLDIMLPGLTGLDVLRQLRGAGDRTPVLMLSARGDDVDRIDGLERGADDYLAKPFNPRELVARIRAILRRTTDIAGEQPVELAVGPLRANLRRRDATLGENTLRLTNAEFTILATLMRTPGEVVSRDALTLTALGRRLLPDDRSLDTHISNLRRKLEAASGEFVIRSVRGSGYMLVPPAD